METQKTVTISSTVELEIEKDMFATEFGQSKSEIYKRAHILYFATERRKRRVNVNE